MESQKLDSPLRVHEGYINFSVSLNSDRAATTLYVMTQWCSSKFTKLLEVMGYVEGGA